MQAIIPKFLPATNRRGSRIKATCERGSITIDYPHHSDSDEIHREAVRALIAKFVREDEKTGTPAKDNPWNRPFVSGGTKDFECHVYPSPFLNQVLVQCIDQKDADYVKRYIKVARETDGTVTGCLHGCACSALHRSKEAAL